jgi:DNA primase
MIATNSQKIKLIQAYFKKGELSRGEDQLAVRCPACNPSDKAKRKLSIRISDGWYHCWVCGLSGKSFYSLFKKTFPDAVHNPEVSALFEERKSSFLQPSAQKEIEKVSLPEDLFLVASDDTKDPDVLHVRNYLKSRGLTKSDMFRWRICAARSGQFRRKAIIPSFDSDGELNYYVARSIDESVYKYTNAKKHKTEIIFNEIDIDWKKPITLVEGVFDAIKSPENTIPVLGSELPKESALFKKIWENECRVTVAFDPDLKEKSHRLCEAFSSAGLDVFQVWAPDGRDFGSMTKREVAEVLKSAKPWSKESKLFFKIKNISSGSFF